MQFNGQRKGNNRMSKFRLSIILMVLSLFGGSTISVSAQTAEIEVVEGPDRHARSANYINSRAPLQQVAFMKLPVGSIRPAGWLGRYLELQRDGLTGHLGEISAWLDKNNNAWLTNGGDHGWEEVPYWLKGYSCLAYILGDKKMIAETQIITTAAMKA